MKNREIRYLPNYWQWEQRGRFDETEGIKALLALNQGSMANI